MTSRIQQTWPLSDTDLQPALTLALAIEHAPMGILMLRDEKTGELEAVAAEGITQEQRERFGRHRPGIGPLGVAYSEHRRVTVLDIEGDGNGNGDTDGSLRELANAMGFRCLDVVPLMLADGAVIGVFAALFPRSRRQTARTSHMSDLCARLVALALENARMRADEERRRKIVEALARARVQFVARISHELRTPLQSIMGYIDLLRLGRPDPLTHNQAHMLERVREGEQVILRVIDDLLSMARLEAGRLEYDIGAVMVGDAIAAAVSIVQPLALRKHLHLDAPASSLIARADVTKLKQIFINLLANAVKFTPAGGIVSVHTRREGGMIVIDVSDTGPGIPSDKIQRVFEPYVQAIRPVDGLAGTGLGLAISREFAYRMGGSLSVTSTAGEGAVFTLRLPRAGLATQPRPSISLSPNVG